MNALDNAGIFLIQTIFDLYIMVVMLRILLQWLRADYYNPVCQLILKLTDPVANPLKSFLPGVRGIDLGLIALLIGLELIKLVLVSLLGYGALPNIIGLLVLSLAELCLSLINVFFYAMIAVIILSWVSPGNRHPIIDLLHLITDPIVQPVRRIMPPIGGFDLSAIPVLIGLKLLEIILISPLFQAGLRLAMG